jgi:hypothetical protein
MSRQALLRVDPSEPNPAGSESILSSASGSRPEATIDERK